MTYSYPQDGPSVDAQIAALIAEALPHRTHGDKTLAEIGRSYNVSGWTISRLGRIFASALLLFPPHAQAAPSVPNDCWSGVMAPDKALHGQLVATGPVAQWRVDMSLVVYPTKENYEQINALAEKGQTGTFDTSRPITVIPTWISGPEPGDKDNADEAKEIEIMMKYRTAQGETGTIMLTYWTPMSGRESSLPPDQRATIAQFDQQLHDMSCRGIP